jgi:4-hydroxybenzoate polyprenyltransferase
MSALSLIFRLVWIGICALSMLAQTRLLLGLSLAPSWLDGFVFGGAVFAYNFTHRDRLRKGAAWLVGVFGGACFLLPLLASSLLPLLPLLASSLLPLSASSPTIPWQAAALVPAVLWLFYYGLQRPGNAGLRGVPMAKPVVVALAWAWVTVMLPVPMKQWGSVVGVFLGRSLFIFALALAYDLADLEYDRRHKLATLAGKLGFEKTFLLINGALTVATVSSLANYFLKIYGLNLAIGLLASLVFSAWQLRFLLKKTGWQSWQKVLIDGLMPLQFLLIWGASEVSK